MDRLKLFQQQQRILKKGSETPFVHLAPNPQAVDAILDVSVDHNRLEQLAYRLDWSAPIEGCRRDAQALLAELSGSFYEPRWDDLIHDSGKDLLRSLAGPFGLGKLFAAWDKTGGPVDTIHNARQNVYATDSEKDAYDKREKYSLSKKEKRETGVQGVSDKVHKDKRYTSENQRQTGAFKAGEEPVDVYTGQALKRGTPDGQTKVNLDHVISAHEVHDDRGRVLAGLSTEEVANRRENLTLTTEAINKSKKDKSPEEFARYVEEKKAEWQACIDQLEEKKRAGGLTGEDAATLKSLKERIQIDPAKVRERGEQARKDQGRTINMTYYTSKKFFHNSISTSAMEGGRMALQQAMGVILIEFFASLIDEYRDLMAEGRKGKTFFEDLKMRGLRICEGLMSKWSEIVHTSLRGFLSGFLSNLLTIGINAFLTTAKRAVRMIREGFHSLLRAMKMVLFPPKDLSPQQARHEALKLFAAGGIIVGGIALEEMVEKLILSQVVLAPFASTLSAVIVGAFSVLATCISAYLIDKADFFGAIKIEENRFVIASLSDKTAQSLQECESVLSDIDMMLLPSGEYALA
jgi:hypothetical protein